METYFDGERFIEIDGTIAASEAGWVGKPEYRISYKLSSGGYLSGTKHMDRGKLLTDVKRTKRLPSWATQKYQKPIDCKALRHSLALNCQDFGELVGVSGRTVEQWEQNRRKPSKSALMLMAQLIKKGK